MPKSSPPLVPAFGPRLWSPPLVPALGLCDGAEQTGCKTYGVTGRGLGVRLAQRAGAIVLRKRCNGNNW
jgi:hypothetical protein